jgi:hypothetical protein
VSIVLEALPADCGWMTGKPELSDKFIPTSGMPTNLPERA